MTTDKLSLCIPAILPLRNLQIASFGTVLKQAYRTLSKFNSFLSGCSSDQREILFHEEVKSSYLMPIEAVRSIARSRRFSIRLLCRTQGLIRKGSGDLEDTGKIRNREHWIDFKKKGEGEACFSPPDLNHLKKGLKNLTDYLQLEEDPLVQCAVSFAQLLILHPFMDANGRAARLMIPIFLCQKKVLSKPLFFMGHYFKKNRIKYLQKLYFISAKREWEGWIRFFLQGVAQEGERLLKKTARSVDIS